MTPEQLNYIISVSHQCDLWIKKLNRIKLMTDMLTNCQHWIAQREFYIQKEDLKPLSICYLVISKQDALKEIERFNKIGNYIYQRLKQTIK